MRDGIISPFGVCFREKYVVYIFIYNTLSLFTEYTLMRFTINTLFMETNRCLVFCKRFYTFGQYGLSLWSPSLGWVFQTFNQ